MDAEKYQDELLRSVNDTANQARTVLTATLMVAVALAAVVLSTTDEAILYDQLQVVPTIGVSVKVSMLYTLMPPVFLFLHANALLKLDSLADRLAALPKAAEGAGVDPVRLASLVSAFSFARLTLDSEGQGWTRRLLGIVGWLSVAFVPLLLLVLTQISFVRYQNEWLSRLHTVIVLADVALIGWFLARQYRRRRDEGREWGPSAIRNTAVGALMAAISLLAAHPPPATLPAESVRVPSHLFAWDGTSWSSRERDRVAFERFLVNRLLALNLNVLDFVACPGLGWGCRYLRLDRHIFAQSTTIVSAIDVLALTEEDRAAAKRMAIAVDVRDRSLRFADLRESWFLDANLAGADFSRADMTLAHLDRAVLRRAKLNHARLDFGTLNYASLENAELLGASLDKAELYGAKLFNAKLHGASLFDAKLQGAYLVETELHGANLVFAKLHGAHLHKAKLHGAQLRNAQLYGADLNGAELNGAWLDGAELQGASLSGEAKLQGARFNWSKLHGALLDFAAFRGAWLNNAEMHGASGHGVAECREATVLKLVGIGEVWPQTSYEVVVSSIRANSKLSSQDVERLVVQVGKAKSRVGGVRCELEGVELANSTLDRLDGLAGMHGAALRDAACQSPEAAAAILLRIVGYPENYHESPEERLIIGHRLLAVASEPQRGCIGLTNALSPKERVTMASQGRERIEDARRTLKLLARHNSP